MQWYTGGCERSSFKLSCLAPLFSPVLLYVVNALPAYSSCLHVPTRMCQHISLTGVRGGVYGLFDDLGGGADFKRSHISGPRRCVHLSHTHTHTHTHTYTHTYTRGRLAKACGGTDVGDVDRMPWVLVPVCKLSAAARARYNALFESSRWCTHAYEPDTVLPRSTIPSDVQEIHRKDL